MGSPHSAAAWSVGLFLAASLYAHTVAARLLLLLGAIVLCSWTLMREREAVHGLPPIWPAFALWTAWAALSIAWSEDVARSVKELRNEFVYTGFALWTCFVAAQARSAPRTLLTVMGTAGAAASALALYYFFGDPGKYPRGVHGGSGNHSSVVLVLMPCALMSGWYALRARRPYIAAAAAALAALFVLSAYTTLNRTVWIGFLAELLIIVVLLLAVRPGSSILRSKALLFAVLALVSAGAVAMTLIVHSERVAGGAPTELKKDARVAIWPEALELIETHPIAGYGVGRGNLRRTLVKETGDALAWHAHNLFLDVLLQTGLPGLALLLVLLGATLRAAWRLCRKSDDVAVACGIALAAVVAGMLVRNMTDVLWVRGNALLYWGVVGALLGLPARAR